MSIEEITVKPKINAQEWFGKGYLEITNGLPFQSAQEMFDLLYDVYMTVVDNNAISRIPIMGTSDGKIFIQTNFFDGRIEHMALAQILEEQGYAGITKKDNTHMAFTASIESMHLLTKPVMSKGYLAIQAEFNGIPHTFYWGAGNGSDYFPAGLTAEGRVRLIEMFNRIPGVSLDI